MNIYHSEFHRGVTSGILLTGDSIKRVERLLKDKGL